MTETRAPYLLTPPVPFGERLQSLADPLPLYAIASRLDSKPTLRDGRWGARAVLYVEAWYCQQRLDSVFPGEWSCEITPILFRGDAVAEERQVAVRCKVTILSGTHLATREDVGQGKDWKNASTDAFKRACARFGIARELYLSEQLWVEVESGDKYAKPLRDPAVTYIKRYGSLPRLPEYEHTVSADGEAKMLKSREAKEAGEREAAGIRRDVPSAAPRIEGPKPVVTAHDGVDPYAPSAVRADEQTCPKCGGRVWDNRLTKRNPKAPDFKCRDRSCDGVIWPGEQKDAFAPRETVGPGPLDDDGAPPLTDDDLPF